MILKGFKEKSNKKYLNKLLTERQLSIVDSKIESLGVILNIDEFGDFELFRKLAKHLNIRPNKIKIIAFSKKKKYDLNSWDLCFNPNDFGWNGDIKNIELQSFLDIKFDALISYYEKEVLEIKLITALSESKFKISIFQTDERLNDLIVKTNINQFDVFQKEVFKYLTILNKIN